MYKQGFQLLEKALKHSWNYKDFTSTTQMIQACVTRQTLSPCGWGVDMRLCWRVACTFVFCFWQVCGTVCTSTFGPQDHLSISISKQKRIWCGGWRTSTTIATTLIQFGLTLSTIYKWSHTPGRNQWTWIRPEIHCRCCDVTLNWSYNYSTSVSLILSDLNCPAIVTHFPPSKRFYVWALLYEYT